MKSDYMTLRRTKMKLLWQEIPNYPASSLSNSDNQSEWKHQSQRCKIIVEKIVHIFFSQKTTTMAIKQMK